MDSSQALYDVAQKYLPGGVSASARLSPALGRPFFASRGDGAYVFDLDGRQYIVVGAGDSLYAFALQP